MRAENVAERIMLMSDQDEDSEREDGGQPQDEEKMDDDEGTMRDADSSEDRRKDGGQPQDEENVGSNKSVRKRSRSGEESTAREKAKHPMRQSCTHNWNSKFFHCKDVVSENRREQIYEQFWKNNYNDRRRFLASCMTFESKKRATVGEISRRNVSCTYQIKDENNVVVKVCKTMLLGTLGYHTDEILRTVRKSVEMAKREGEAPIMVPPSKRGRHEPKNKLEKTSIKSHIEKYRPCISHYRREHAPRRMYLSPELTIRVMHADFNATHEHVSYDTYRKEVKAMNISFARLGEEECETCGAYESTHSKDENHNPECEVCRAQERHLKKAQKAREDYQRDRNDSDQSTLYAAVDMQKVILLPHMPMYKATAFTPRLVVFNETFAALGNCGKTKKFKGDIVVWHEGIAGRSASDVSAAYWTFLLEHRDEERITLWCDNCAPQNKNYILFTMLMSAVNQEELLCLKELTVKYFEPGHTFNAADSVHAAIEKTTKQVRYINEQINFTT